MLISTLTAASSTASWVGAPGSAVHVAQLRKAMGDRGEHQPVSRPRRPGRGSPRPWAWISPTAEEDGLAIRIDDVDGDEHVGVVDDEESVRCAACARRAARRSRTAAVTNDTPTSRDPGRRPGTRRWRRRPVARPAAPPSPRRGGARGVRRPVAAMTARRATRSPRVR